MPETTENYHHIPGPGGEGAHDGPEHKIRTLDVKGVEGLKMRYCVTCKQVATWLFDVKRWSMEEAKKWVAEHKAEVTEVASGAAYGIKIIKGEDGEREKAKQAQTARAKKYGISAKEGGNITKPGQWSQVPDTEFLDPVNYRYPCPDADQTRAAAAYWGKPKNQQQYSSTERGIINKRLDGFKRKFNIGEYAKAVKAVEEDGEWILEGWGAPYGGPIEGKDKYGEYFSEETDFSLDYYPSRPVVFHHGLTEEAPEVIGRELSHEKRGGGVWVRTVLDKTKELAKRAWQMAQEGKLFWSSGAIAHLVRKAKDGHVLKWPIAEWSATPNPVNPYATVTASVAKARFKAIGIEFDDGAPSDGDGESPEGRRDEKPPVEGQQKQNTEVIVMGEELTQERLSEMIAEAVKAAREAAAAEEQAEKNAEELEGLRKEVPDLRKEIEELKAQMARKGIFPEDEDGDKVTVKGSFWDQQDPADRELVAQMLLGARKPLSDDLRRSLKGGLEEGLGEAYPWLKSEGRLEAQMKAIALMDKTDTANWVPTGYEKRVWDRLRLENHAAAQFTNMDLPEDSYNLPIATAGPTVYVVPEQTAGTPTLATGITTSQITDGKVTFSTSKLGAAVWFSGELDEDGIIPQLPIVRDQIGKAQDEAIENGILNGDKTTGTKNISAATPGTTDKNIVCDGLRHFGLVDATTFKRDCGALDLDDVLAIRQLMGKYGIRPSDLVWFCDYNTIYKIMGFDEFVTVDKLGPKAVVVAGEVGELLGSPLIVSGEMNKFGTDGKYAATPTTGVLIAAHKPSWIVGWRRRIKFGVTYYDHLDATRVTSLLRMDFQKFGTSSGHAAVGYDITL